MKELPVAPKHTDKIGIIHYLRRISPGPPSTYFNGVTVQRWLDHGQGQKCYFLVLVCWFACRDCLRDTALDGYAIFLFVCLCGGGRSATGWVALVGSFVGCLVGLLVWPRCCLVGWSVGWHSVDGWMHACMDGSCAASRSGGVRVSFRRFPAFRTVSAQFAEGSEGLVTRSY